MLVENSFVLFLESFLIHFTYLLLIAFFNKMNVQVSISLQIALSFCLAIENTCINIR